MAKKKVKTKKIKNFDTLPKALALKLYKAHKKHEKSREKYNLIVDSIFDEYGEGVVTHKIKKGYLRLSVTDNINELKKKSIVFRAAAFPRISLALRVLVKKPENFEEEVE